MKYAADFRCIARSALRGRWGVAVLAENPEMTATQAIERSKSMMYGYRFRLFCLHCSFIGWGILCAFTLGIGMLWLRPYQEAAYAASYRDASGNKVM